MAKQKASKANGPHVNKGKDKTSIKSGTDCSNLGASKGTTSPIYKAQPGLQAPGAQLVAAGTTLGTADAAVNSAKAALHAAQGQLDTATGQWNAAYDVYVSHVEQKSTKPEDIAGLGLTALEKGVYTLAAPTAIELKYDPKLDLIRVHVILPPGMEHVGGRDDPNPVTATSFARLVGKGVKRTVKGPPPGTWWFRAAAVRASQQSAFFGPVSVVVR